VLLCYVNRFCVLLLGANPSAVDRHGNAALHIATLFGHLQLVKMLLKYDADVYQRGSKGAIPSHIAAREGHIHLIQVCMHSGIMAGGTICHPTHA